MAKSEIVSCPNQRKIRFVCQILFGEFFTAKTVHFPKIALNNDLNSKFEKSSPSLFIGGEEMGLY